MPDNFTTNAGTGGATFASQEIAGVHRPRMKVELGAGATSEGDVGRGNPMPVFDRLALARGLDSGLTPVHIEGRNTDADQSPVEDVTNIGGVWVPPTAARIHDLKSNDAADDSAGTGARTVLVTGVNNAGAWDSETVSLSGLTNAPTTKSWQILFLEAATFGTGGANVGTITAIAQTDATTTAQINPGRSVSEMAVYLVPDSLTLYIDRFYGEVVNGTARVEFQLWTKSAAAGAGWVLRRQLTTRPSDGKTAAERRFATPLAIPAQTLVTVRAVVSAADQDVLAGFEGVLA